MTAKVKRGFSGILSQSVVVCVLAAFIAIALVAMFSTIGMSDETEWIGMTVKCLDAERAAALGIPSDAGGVIVGEVDGIARQAGIRHGDVLLGINGKPVQDVADFSKLVRKADLSRGAQLDVIRRGVRIPVFILPPGAPGRPPGQTATDGIAGQPLALQGLWDRRSLGIDAEPFRAGEGRELGIPAGVRGVLVDGVARDSLAEQVGLVVNDVIVSVNGQRVDGTADLWSALAGLNGAGQVEFGLYRKGRLMSLALLAASLTTAGGLPAAPAAGQLAAPAWSAGAGRMGGRGLGPGGSLVCPNCGTRVAHQRGVPCFTVPCPSCGALMTRAR